MATSLLTIYPLTYSPSQSSATRYGQLRNKIAAMESAKYRSESGRAVPDSIKYAATAG